MTIGSTQAFTIEGWNTDFGTDSWHDKTRVEGDADSSLNLTYYWKCTNPDGSLCQYGVGTPIYVINAKSTTFPADTFASGSVLKFCFHIDSVINGSTVGSIPVCKTVTVNSDTTQFFPQIRSSSARVNPNQGVILSCDSSVTAGVGYTWDVTSGNLQSSAFEYLYEGETLASIFKQRYLQIKPYVLDQTQSYTFGCAVGYTSSKTLENTTYTLVINKAPTNGSISVSPSTGIELTELFTISAPYWEDEDGNYPLFYSYYYRSGSTYLTIRENSTASSLRTVLPAGDASNWLHIMVAISDVDGAAVNITTQVYITNLTASEEQTRMKYLLAKSNMSADLEDFTQAMTMVLDRVSESDTAAKEYYYPVLIDSTAMLTSP